MRKLHAEGNTSKNLAEEMTYKNCCSSLLSAAVTKPAWGRKFTSLTGDSPSLKKDKANPGSQELKDRPQRNTTYWFSFPLLVQLILYNQAALLRDGTTYSGLGLPTSIINQDMHTGHLLEAFLN